MGLEDAVDAPEARAAAVLEHRLGVEVAPAGGRRRADDLVEERLRLGVALERRPLAALLVVEDEAERQPRAARPLRVGRMLPVADEVALGHALLRATASISTRIPAGKPAWTLVRAGIRLREELAVDAVVAVEVAKIREERVHLHHVVERAPGRIEAGAYVLERLPRLLLDAARDERALGVVRDLPRRVDEIAADHHGRERRLRHRHPVRLKRLSSACVSPFVVTEHASLVELPDALRRVAAQLDQRLLRVLAALGCPSGGCSGTGHPQRRGHLAHRSELGMVVFHEPGLVECRRHLVDRRRRHAGLVKHRLSHSSDERLPNTDSRIGSSSSRLRSRAAKSANRGSLASSGLPMASQSASQNFCFGQATTIQPSAVGKFWKRHDRRVGGVAPPRRYVAARRRPGPDVHELMESGLEERDVAVAADAVAAGAPEPRQHCDRRRVPAGEVDEREPLFVGGPSGSPVRLIQPASPCIM